MRSLLHGRKRRGGARMDHGCGIKGRNNLKLARGALAARGWIAVEEDLTDRARPRRWYRVIIESETPIPPSNTDDNNSDGQVSNSDSRLSVSDTLSSKTDSSVSETDTRTYRRDSSRDPEKDHLEEMHGRGALCAPVETEGASRPQASSDDAPIIKVCNNAGDVKEGANSIGFDGSDTGNAPQAQDSKPSELFLPASQTGVAPMVDTAAPVVAQAPAQETASGTGRIETLAELTPKEINSLFQRTVKAANAAAILYKYRDWDAKQIPEILRRFTSRQDFVQAVKGYAKTLGSGKAATLRSFVEATLSRSSSTRPQGSNRDAIATPPARTLPARSEDEIREDLARAVREQAERAEKTRIYEIAKRMLKVYCDVLVEQGVRLNMIFWDRPLTNAESIEKVIRKHLSVLSESEIVEKITKFATWDARRRLEYAKSISCPAAVGNSELGYFEDHYTNWMKTMAPTPDHPAV